MGKVLVECQWLILDFDKDDFREILRLATLLECLLWIEEARTFIDGYQIVALFVSAEAEEFIKIFRRTIERFAKLSHCRVSKQALHNLTPLHDVVLRQRFVQRSEMYDFLETVSIHNRRVRDHLPLWVTASWVMAPTEHAVLERALHMAQDNDIAIFYQVKRLMKPEIQFYFKISHARDFNLCMNRLKKSMDLKPWTMTFEVEDYDTFETYPRLVRSTLTTFLHVVERHF